MLFLGLEYLFALYANVQACPSPPIRKHPQYVVIWFEHMNSK